MATTEDTWRATGAQFDVFGKDLSDFEKLTLSLIRTFETALRKDGYTVLIGLEEEVAIHAPSLNEKTAPIPPGDYRNNKPPEKNKGSVPPGEKTEIWPASEQFAADMQKAIMDAHRQFTPPDKAGMTPTIERIEHTARRNQNRFEIVTAPLPPVRAALLGRAIIRNFHLASEEGASGMPEEQLSAFARRVRKTGPSYTSVRFHPKLENAFYSQHGNTSIHQKERGNLMTDPEISGQFSESLKTLTRSDLLPLMINSASRNRIREREHSDTSSLERSVRARGEGQQHSRVEFRAPDASTHPFLTVLFNMAAAYNTVGHPKHPAPELPPDADKDSLLSFFNNRTARFERSSTLLPLIQDVLERTGTPSEEAARITTQFKDGILDAYRQHSVYSPSVGIPFRD